MAKASSLFPIYQLVKNPLVTGWQQLATTNIEALQSWASHFPHCNWGVACGPESNVFVLDVDNKNGNKGFESLATLEEEHGKLPLTLTSLTGSGQGRQYWFQYPPNAECLKNLNGKLGDGLDVKVKGGYVVAPPSVTTVPYTFVDKNTPLAPVPEWLLAKLKTLSKKAPAPPKDDGSPKDPPLIPKGKGHPYLASLAGAMLKKGVSLAVLLAALQEANKAQFVEPYPDSEIDKKAQDFYKRWATTGIVVDAKDDEWEPSVICLADVEEKEVEWLWYPYLPLGLLSMLSGDPGVGKSYITIDIAAAVTMGRVPYTGKICYPANVLYLSKENDPEHSVKKRFRLAEGDSNRFFILEGSKSSNSGQTNQVTLSDVSILDGAINKYKARFVIVDPIQSYLGAEVDMFRSNQTRPLLDEVAALAKKHKCCILIVRHFTKARAGRAIHSGAGTGDLTGVVRSEMHAGHAANDPTQKAFLIAKTNVATLGQALAYTIEEGDRFEWLGASELTAMDLQAPESNEEKGKVDEAKEFLLTILAGGAQPSQTVKSKAKEEGISEAALRRARTKLKVVVDKLGGGGSNWKLPSCSAPGSP